MSVISPQQPVVGPRNGGVLDLFSLKGRVILVTGAAGGLGLNFTKACLEAGAKVAAIDISDDPGNPVPWTTEVSELQYRYYKASVTDEVLIEATVQQAVKDFGAIHGAITCAGVAGETPFADYPMDKVRQIIDINLLGTYCTAQSVVRQLLKQGTGGSIVLISSVASHQANRTHPVSAYGASKYAVRGLAQQIATEYATKNIRVNSISPGPMMTDMSRRLAAGHPQVFTELANHIMLGRMGEPDELDGAAIFLLSDASSFVTGEDILVDGGQGHFV